MLFDWTVIRRLINDIFYIILCRYVFSGISPTKVSSVIRV